VFVLLERSGTVQDPHVVVRGVDEHAADGPENPIPLKFRPGGIDLERWYAARWLLGRNRAFDDGDPCGDDDCEDSYGVTSVHFRCSLRALPTSSWGRPAEKQLLPVGQSDVPAYRVIRKILGLKPIDHDLGSGRKRLLREAESVKSVRAAAFDRPSDHFAVGA